MKISKITSKIRQNAEKISNIANNIDTGCSNIIAIIITFLLAPIWVICVIGAGIASFGLIFGAEYFIFALATKLICFILKESWFGWKIAFFAYLIVVILSTIFNIFHKETTD